MRKLFALLMIVISISGHFSCRDHKSAITLMPGMKDSDSAAVMFYNTPNNPRFFKYSKVKDMKLLQPVINDLGKKIINSREDCATQGKIYFYGEGDAVDVVYFSGSEDCMTFSYIVTGEKYFTQMSKVSKELLTNLQKDAIEPAVRSQ